MLLTLLTIRARTAKNPPPNQIEFATFGSNRVPVRKLVFIRICRKRGLPINDARFKEEIESEYRCSIAELSVQQHSGGLPCDNWGFCRGTHVSRATFACAEMAARVLRMRCQKSCGSKWYVHDAPFHEQPDAKAISTMMRMPLNRFVADQPAPINRLNPDCLLHIYQYLGVGDIARAAEASHFLAEFATNNVYHKYTNVDGRTIGKWCKLPQREFVIVLRQIGPHIQRLTVDFELFAELQRPWAIAIVLKYCTQLQMLDANFDSDVPETVANGLKRNFTINNLSVTCALLGASVNTLIHKFVCLKKLSIFTRFDDEFSDHRLCLSRINRMQMLQTNCMYTSPANFRRFIERNSATLSVLHFPAGHANLVSDFRLCLENVSHLTRLTVFAYNGLLHFQILDGRASLKILNVDHRNLLPVPKPLLATVELYTLGPNIDVTVEDLIKSLPNLNTVAMALLDAGRVCRAIRANNAYNCHYTYDSYDCDVMKVDTSLLISKPNIKFVQLTDADVTKDVYKSLCFLK